MPTMKDVADYAGVSITTVSHVLNETRYVSSELAERVQTAVEELGYKRNLVARSLRRQQTQTLGMIVPDNANPFFAEVARKIEDACFEMGYSLILCNTDQNVEREREYIDLLIAKQVDGILLVASGTHTQHLSSILQQNTPLVLVDRFVDDVECDVVLVDNRAGGKTATAHLVNQGCKRIACITGPSDVTPSWERVQGYKEALEEAGLPIDEQLVLRGNFRPTSGYLATRNLLTLTKTPDAVFACNDLMAIGAMHAIWEGGLQVPRDIRVVGFDNISLASHVYPALTTIAQPYEEIGRLAAELLVQRIEDRRHRVEQLCLATELIVRHSS